jgi:hypothetical protein
MSIQKKIEETLNRSVCGGWDRGFLESILDQIAKGRDLSVKQKQTMGKVLARNSEEDQAKHISWESVYEAEHKSNALILASYHVQQPYYKPMAQDILSDRIPERSKFLRMYDNKYSKKVLSQYAAPAKYELGDYLQPRARFDPHKNIEIAGYDLMWSAKKALVGNFSTKGGFVLKVCREIHSAAKGSKRYKILPIGTTTPIIVEERFLKKVKAQN